MKRQIAPFFVYVFAIWNVVGNKQSPILREAFKNSLTSKSEHILLFPQNLFYTSSNVMSSMAPRVLRNSIFLGFAVCQTSFSSTCVSPVHTTFQRTSAPCGDNAPIVRMELDENWSDLG